MIGRHLLASHGSAFDLAWTTMGATPELVGERSGRLEERVPWASGLIDAESPPLLVGDPTRVLNPENLRRLPQAFLPLDGRLGFSIWGGAERSSLGDEGSCGDEGARGAVTHTFLLDGEAFRAAAGYPLGLLQSFEGGRQRGPGWLMDLALLNLDSFQELAPVALQGRASYDRFADLWWRRLDVLRVTLVDRLGSTVLAAWLAGVYVALEGALSGAGHGQLVLADPETGEPDSAVVRSMILLAWMGLPIADRARVYFTTSWLPPRDAHPLLSPAPAVGTISDHEGTRSVLPIEARELESRSLPEAWAALLASGGVEFRRKITRLEVRGWSLFEGRDVRVSLGVFGPQPHFVPRWIAAPIPSSRGGVHAPRAMGLRMVRELGQNVDPQEVLRVAKNLGEHDRHRFFQGIVRGFRGQTPTVEVAPLAVEAGLATLDTSEGLSLTVGALRRFGEEGVASPESHLDLLVRAVDGVHRIAGVSQARSMVGLSLSLLTRDPQQVPGFLERLPNELLMGLGVLRDLSDWLLAHGRDASRSAFLAGFWTRVSDQVPQPLVRGLERLAWTEVQVFGQTSLTANPAMATRVMSGQPPLALYLQLRSRVTQRSGPAERGVLPVLSRRNGTGRIRS